MARGAASGIYEVKICGKAHAWCRICRPEIANKLTKPKPPRQEYERPCRNCGRCDACLNIQAPEGMKFCRKCKEIKALSLFAIRQDTGGRRNHCNSCRNIGLNIGHCVDCGRRFIRSKAAIYTQCPQCRIKPNRDCPICGVRFSRGNAIYCSRRCQQESIGEQRKRKWKEKRFKIQMD